MSKWFSDKMKRLTFFVLFALSYHNLIEHKHTIEHFMHTHIHIMLYMEREENVYFDIEIFVKELETQRQSDGDQQLEKKKNTISM